MPRQKQIRMTSEDGQEGFCLEESLDAWEANGWTRADDGDSEEAQVVTEHPLETQVADEQPAADPTAAAKKTTTRKAAE